MDEKRKEDEALKLTAEEIDEIIFEEQIASLEEQLHGLEDDDGIAAAGIHVQVHGGTHHLRHVHGAVDRTGGIRGQGDMLRPDAQGNGLGRHLVPLQIGLLVL